MPAIDPKTLRDDLERSHPAVGAEDGEAYNRKVRIHDAARWALALLEGLDYEAGARARYEKHRASIVAALEANDKIAILPTWGELATTERIPMVNDAALVVDAAMPGLTQGGEKT